MRVPASSQSFQSVSTGIDSMKPKPVTDIVIIDEPESCPYLPDQIARMPLRMPLTKITPAETDLRLAQGHRRTGEFIYQTHCPTCNACEPLRVDIGEFRLSKNHRRVINRGDRKFRQEINEMRGDQARTDLFNLHRRERNLAKRDTDIDLEEYVWGFVKSCFKSFEMTYWIDDHLVGVAICDLGLKAMSAVYTFYDPAIQGDSIGTYSILKQIQHCQQKQLRFLYLGYYVDGCSHMTYKSRFKPNDRLIDGQWVRFE
jgi:arginine-tRNA-protein transferase